MIITISQFHKIIGSGHREGLKMQSHHTSLPDEEVDGPVSHTQLLRLLTSRIADLHLSAFHEVRHHLM